MELEVWGEGIDEFVTFEYAEVAACDDGWGVGLVVLGVAFGEEADGAADGVGHPEHDGVVGLFAWFVGGVVEFGVGEFGEVGGVV